MVEFGGTSICLKEVKSYDSTFGSVAYQSTIHFSLKRLTKPAGSYKWSYILYHPKVFGKKNVVFKVVHWF